MGDTLKLREDLDQCIRLQSKRSKQSGVVPPVGIVFRSPPTPPPWSRLMNPKPKESLKVEVDESQSVELGLKQFILKARAVCQAMAGGIE